MNFRILLVLCLLATDAFCAPLFFDFFKNVFRGGRNNNNNNYNPNNINSGGHYVRPQNSAKRRPKFKWDIFGMFGFKKPGGGGGSGGYPGGGGGGSIRPPPARPTVPWSTGRPTSWPPPPTTSRPRPPFTTRPPWPPRPKPPPIRPTSRPPPFPPQTTPGWPDVDKLTNDCHGSWKVIDPNNLNNNNNNNNNIDDGGAVPTYFPTLPSGPLNSNNDNDNSESTTTVAAPLIDFPTTTPPPPAPDFGDENSLDADIIIPATDPSLIDEGNNSTIIIRSYDFLILLHHLIKHLFTLILLAYRLNINSCSNHCDG